MTALSRLSRFATALRALAATALVLAAAAGLVRATAGAFDPFEPYPGHTADYGLPRPRAIRAALPGIAERPEDVVLVFGSSAVARAFVPSVFDDELRRRGASFLSFNLAQLVLQPETALAMAKVVRQTFEGRGKRIRIAVFGISVPELARASLDAARRSMPDQAFVFASADGLRDRARRDPLGALDEGFDFLLFGNVRPERVGLWLEDWWAAHPLGCNSGMKQPPDGREAYDALVDFCAELFRQFPRGVPPWNPSTRGALDFALPKTRPMLERLIALQAASISGEPSPSPTPSPPPQPSDDVDENAVGTIIAALRELAAVTDHLIVLRDILNPALIAPLPPERLARFRGVAERIAHGGNASLLDLNDGTVTAADFGDRTHLNPLAAERFSTVLADRVRPLVEERRALR